MTVLTQTDRNIYSGNGVTLVFPYTFPIIAETDMTVTLIAADGAETDLALGADFTVTGEGTESGGNVTLLVAAPAIGVTVLLLRLVPYTQPTDLKNQGSFYPLTYERMVDRTEMQVQQLKNRQDLSLELPAYVTGVSTTLPVPVASNLIGWNETTTGLRNFTVSEIGTTLAFSNFHADRFTASAAQTDFTLSADPGSIGNLDVSVDGVTQVNGVDFTYLGTTLTFTTPMAGGEKVLARYGTALPTGVTDASAVNFVQAGTGAVTRTMQDKGRELVSVLDFIPVAEHAAIAAGTSTYDCAAAFATVAALIASRPHPPALIFPPGRYRYSLSPNWAMQDAAYDFDGEVRLQYAGTGAAVILDGGASGAGIFNCQFGRNGRVIVEAPASSQDAIYCRSFHAGRVSAKVLGAGTTYAGLYVEWAVCSTFDVIVSVNHEGWYLGAKPHFGYSLAQRGSGSFTTSYCTFVNPIVEGTAIGVQLSGTLGNNFFGGTFEACSQYGVYASAAARSDKFWGVDFEVNTSADVYVLGHDVELRNCDSDGLIVFGPTAVACQVIGGQHKSITLDVGSYACKVRDLTYNRSNLGGTITNSGNCNDVSNITRGAVFAVGVFYPESREDRYIEIVDDFLGDALDARWHAVAGSDPQCIAPTVAGNVLGGSLLLRGGDDPAGTMATNGSQFDAGVLNWRMDRGGFEMQFAVNVETITDVAWFIGMTDQVATLEMPFTMGAGNVLTSNASNAFGILFDTAADTDNWWLVGVKSDVDATSQNAGVAPVAGTTETWRIQVTAAGVATFYRNKLPVGTAMTNAVTTSTLLTPAIIGFSRGAAVRVIGSDYLKLRCFR